MTPDEERRVTNTLLRLPVGTMQTQAGTPEPTAMHFSGSALVAVPSDQACAREDGWVVVFLEDERYALQAEGHCTWGTRPPTDLAISVALRRCQSAQIGREFAALSGTSQVVFGQLVPTQLDLTLR